MTRLRRQASDRPGSSVSPPLIITAVIARLPNTPLYFSRYDLVILSINPSEKTPARKIGRIYLSNEVF